MLSDTIVPQNSGEDSGTARGYVVESKMTPSSTVEGKDVPIVKLMPLRERKVSQKGYKKLVASIKAVGLIEPLCVYPENGHFVILDGYIRYKACLDLGIEVLPCWLYENKEAYTFNKMVSRLSPIQETRMLR